MWLSLVVDGIEGMVVYLHRPKGQGFYPFLMTLALYILLSNFCRRFARWRFAHGQPEYHCGTGSLSPDRVSRGRDQGEGLEAYLKSYVDPYFVLLP